MVGMCCDMCSEPLEAFGLASFVCAPEPPLCWWGLRPGGFPSSATHLLKFIFLSLVPPHVSGISLWLLSAEPVITSFLLVGLVLVSGKSLIHYLAMREEKWKESLRNSKENYCSLCVVLPESRLS